MTSAKDPWDWLLGKTKGGKFRLVGERGMPMANPKILLLKRAIPHPKQVLGKLIEIIDSVDPEDQLRWLCHRSSHPPHRRYWLLFLIPKENEAEDKGQYLFGVEFLDRETLALWFFSGFREPNHLNKSFLEFFENDRDRPLPRFSLDDTSHLPLENWLSEAMRGDLAFSWGFEEDTEAHTEAHTKLCDQSRLVTISLEASAKEKVLEVMLILCEKGENRLVKLGSQRSAIGRHPSCRVMSHNPTVSARHAVLELDPRGAQIVDLGSQNGTFVNGRRIAPKSQMSLPSCALIRLGSLEILFSHCTEESEGLFLNRLIAAGRLSETSLEMKEQEAYRQGLLTEQQLVLEGLVSPEEWVRFRLGDGVFPRADLARPAALSMLTVLAIALVSWWILVSPLQ